MKRSKEMQENFDKMKFFEEEFHSFCEKNAYHPIFLKDIAIPEFVAWKEKHLNLTMVWFLDPASPAVVLHGSRGTADVSYKFYFIMEDPFREKEERFGKMLEATLPYMEEVVIEDRRNF